MRYDIYVLPTCNYSISCEVSESVTNCLLARKYRGHMSLVICADPVMHVVQHLYFVLYPARQVLLHLYFVFIM